MSCELILMTGDSDPLDKYQPTTNQFAFIKSAPIGLFALNYMAVCVLGFYDDNMRVNEPL